MRKLIDMLNEIENNRRKAYDYLSPKLTRKAGTFDEIKAVDFNSMPDFVKEYMKKLHVHKIDVPSPLDSFTVDIVDTDFILDRDGAFYYIDTSGYDYCRYALKLINFST